MESGGVGFFRPGGLMQDPTQLQLMEQQQGKRQQMVLDGCGGEGSGIREAEEECCGEEDEHSRNGGAAACAAAKEGSRKQRLPVVAAFSRKGRPGDADSSGEGSEGAGLDGGAAACAAAMDDAMLNEILLEAGICWFECSAGDVRGWMESEAVTAEARGYWELAQQNVRDRMRQLQQGAECSDEVVRTAAILWDEFDQMNWKGKAARFAGGTEQ